MKDPDLNITVIVDGYGTVSAQNCGVLLYSSSGVILVIMSKITFGKISINMFMGNIFNTSYRRHIQVW